MNAVMVYSARQSIGKHLPDAIDITRATAQSLLDRGLPAPGETLAPSWSILRPAKARLKAAARNGDVLEMDRIWNWYVGAYIAEQGERDQREPHRLDAILARTSVTLLCVCSDDARCHRSIARLTILPRHGAAIGSERRPQLDLRLPSLTRIHEVHQGAVSRHGTKGFPRRPAR